MITAYQIHSRPRMYRTMPACHCDGSSTPSHAKDTATARIVKNMVILGLEYRGEWIRIVQDRQKHVPPRAIVSPCTDEQEDSGLQREADTIREQDDGVDCAERWSQEVTFSSSGDLLSRTRPRKGSTQSVPEPQAALNGGWLGSYPARYSRF